MLKNLLHGLARALTVPKAVRAQIDANPLTSLAKSALESDLAAAVAGAIDKHISDPALADAAKREAGALLSATGLLK